MCLQIAANYPEYARGVILVASIWAGGKHFYNTDKKGGKTKCKAWDEVRNHPAIVQIDEMLRGQNRDFIQNMIDAALFNIQSPSDQELKLFSEEVLRCRAYGEVTPALHFFDLISDSSYKKIRCRVLVFHGTDDIVIKPNYAEKNAKLFPPEQVRLVIKQNCSHSPPYDCPRDLAQEIDLLASQTEGIHQAKL